MKVYPDTGSGKISYSQFKAVWSTPTYMFVGLELSLLKQLDH